MFDRVNMKHTIPSPSMLTQQQPAKRRGEEGLLMC